jgi:hypothetical protein
MVKRLVVLRPGLVDPMPALLGTKNESIVPFRGTLQMPGRMSKATWHVCTHEPGFNLYCCLSFYSVLNKHSPLHCEKRLLELKAEFLGVVEP